LHFGASKVKQHLKEGQQSKIYLKRTGMSSNFVLAVEQS